MTESLTFTWHDVAGEARPSPTTRKKLDEWKQAVKDPDGDSDFVYYLDFLGDVIGELQRKYDSILVASRDAGEAVMEWRPASVPFYEVSEQGDLRLLVNRSNRVAGTALKGSVKQKGGYRQYKIWVGGKATTVTSHREVLIAFVGPPPSPSHQCAHWDGDPSNNHYSNLRWATAAENTADKVRHGRHRKGRRSLTEEQVLKIRALRDRGKSYAEIQEIFPVSKGNLSAIINRKTWDYI